jgi:hypothetical protein
MSAPIEFLSAIPLSLLAAAVIVRYGGEVLVMVCAALVAIFARDRERARRAMAVLRLLRRNPQHSNDGARSTPKPRRLQRRS